MDGPEFADILGPALAAALEQKGFQRLTPVQEAVLDPALAGRDLRITSQTGSGKTVAIGFAVRALVESATGAPGTAKPRVLVVAPTRELAKQVEEELRWLFLPLRARVASATGGASYQDERRALASGPAIVVGTPGRLLDHLGRRAIDPSELGAIVLDEADRMLDLGFREDLEAILGYAPKGHRTHLISATFPRGVKALADKVQIEPAHVEGTPLGAANADIDHVVHLVDPYQRVDAIINLLLACPDQQTLVFARTRADVARVARELHQAGFAVSSISGEMEQPERNRALADFKRGKLRVLVATDVAARGIDVQDIARVIHAEPPDDPDSYTHRSGRTGRAGRKGQSAVLCSPSALSKTSLLLKRARVQFRVEPIPTAADIEKGREERLYTELLADDPEGFAGHDDRLWAFAKRLTADPARVTRTVARLLERADYAGPAEPREVRNFAKPKEGGAQFDRRPRSNDDFRSNDRGRPSSRPAPRVEHGRPERAFPRSEHPAGPRSEHAAAPRPYVRNGADAAEGRQDRRPPRGPTSDAPRARRDHGPSDEGAPSSGGFVPFRVSWGGEQGADPRRLLAMVCRRGEVRGTDVGNIRVARGFSTVEIAANVADAFAETVAKPDPRNPRVFIKRDAGRAPPREVAANS
jgi:ATP-dependent RNA helicase DeaD